MTTIIKVSDEREIINRLSSYVEKISNDAINNRGRFYVGLSGEYLKFSNFPFNVVFVLQSFHITTN